MAAKCEKGDFMPAALKPPFSLFVAIFLQNHLLAAIPPFVCPFFNIITVILLKNGPKKRGLHLEGDFVKKWAVKYML